ncbi:glycosyltransferase [Streptococcus uberis]|uniref:glycosyltransferase n=1 Tax=Streptococcus uberis TaxID=1349 RepID=UPI00193A0FE4|nr:glycosyltransferase [Streptococcus uberis]
MKILQINSVISYGSTGAIVRDIYDVLNSEGHDCLVAFGRGDYVDGYKSIKFSSSIEVLVHMLSSRIFDNHGLMSQYSTKKLIKLIKEFEPDIIQLHNIHGYYLNYKLLFEYLSKTNIPIVWLMHDQWALSGGPAYIDDIESHRMSRSISEKSSYPKTFFLDRYFNNLNQKVKSFSKLNNLTIVTPSNWLSEQFKKSFLGHNNVRTIHNGIDISCFKPSFIFDSNRENISTKKQLLGVASVWDYRKGAEFFYKLSRDLGNEYHIRMVGVDDSIESYVKSNNLNIELIKKTNSRQELVDLYTQADILINPTLQDNFPTVNIESLACGTPVITFDTGGSGESIINEKTGLIIKKGSYDMLLKAIKKWPKKNQDIVLNCVEHSKLFDKKVIYSKYIKLYKKILEEKNGL